MFNLKKITLKISKELAHKKKVGEAILTHQKIRRASDEVVELWKKMIPQHFDRREVIYGHSNTGALANSLKFTTRRKGDEIIMDFFSDVKSHRGDKKPRNYLTILITNNLTPSIGAYNVKLDKRMKYGIWRGIPSSYWENFSNNYANALSTLFEKKMRLVVDIADLEITKVSGYVEV